MQFTVGTESVAPDRRVVAAVGELDLTSARQLRHALSASVEDPDVAEVRVDLAAVTFIDSSGIGTLIAASNAAVRMGKTFLVGPVSKQVAQVLHLIGVGESLGLTMDPGDEAITLYEGPEWEA